MAQIVHTQKNNFSFCVNMFWDAIVSKKGKAEYSWLRFNAEDFNGQLVLATGTWGAIHSYSTLLNTPTPTFWGHPTSEKKNESGWYMISTSLTEEQIRTNARGFTFLADQQLKKSQFFYLNRKPLAESMHSSN